MAKGNIIVVKPNGDFEQVPARAIRDCSPETIGVYCKLLTFGEEWSLNIKGLSTCMGISVDRVRRAISSLEQQGYIVRRAIYKDGRLQGWNYYIYGNAVSEDERSHAGFSHGQIQSCPKSANTENGEDIISTPVINDHTYINNQINNISEGKEINKEKEKFDFRSALVDAGVSEEVADAWMQVRKNRRATNTKIAFDDTLREIEASGYSADECIRMAVVKSWQGFKAEWMHNAKTSYNRKAEKESSFQKDIRSIDELTGSNLYEKYYGSR